VNGAIYANVIQNYFCGIRDNSSNKFRNIYQTLVWAN
jgi:hypothetical protein